MIKTAIARYRSRSNPSSPDYIEIKNSATVRAFCSKHLSNPSVRSGIQERIFMDIKPDIFLQRKATTIEKVKTLAGISTKYQYVVEVIFNYLLVLGNLISFYLVEWHC